MDSFYLCDVLSNLDAMQSNVAIILSQNHSYGAKKQKKNRTQCAKGANETNAFSFRIFVFFPNLFCFPLLKRAKKAPTSTVSALFLSLRNTNISLLCFFLCWMEGTLMPTTVKSIRMIQFEWHCIPSVHEFKANKTEWALFNFENSFLHRKKGYINRLDIGKEEEEEEEVENH